MYTLLLYKKCDLHNFLYVAYIFMYI